MNSTQIQCFMTAARLLNFTRAAEELFITQPALSRNISGLEEELKLLLFVRHNNVLTLTAGGQILYNWLCQSNKDFEAALESARQANTRSDQNLRIGFVRSELPSLRVAWALKRLSKKQPDIQVFFDHFLSHEIIEKLEEHTMDVAVMVSSAAQGNPRLITKTLAKLKRYIVVSCFHPMASRDKVSLSDCAGETFISVKPEASPKLTKNLRYLCRQSGFEPLVLEAADTEQQQQWIASGKGIGLLPENHVKHGNPLYVFLDLEEQPGVDLVCVWDRLNTNPHIQSFLDEFTPE